MPELNIGIDASVLSSLTELPGQVLAAIGPAQQAIDQARQGGGPGAAIEGLFGTLGSLAGDLGQLPDMSELIGGLSGLGDLLPTGAIGDSGALQGALGEFSGLFGPVFDLLSGDPQAALSAAVTRAGDLVSSVKGGGGELGAIGDEFTHFLQLLGSLDDWGTAPPSPATVAGLLAQALVGVRLDVLAAPTAALAATMAHLADLVPPGVDLDRWRVGVAAQLGRWTAIEARLAGPTVDWTALEADIQVAGHELVELVAARDRLISAAVGAMTRIDLSSLHAVADALRAIPEIPDIRLTPVLDGLRDQMGGIRDFLRTWHPDAADGRQLVRGLMQKLLELLEHSPLGQARNAILSFEQRILATIEDLPLRALAEELTAIVRQVADAIESVDIDRLFRPIHEFGDAVRDKITSVSGDVVKASIGQVWDTVEAALTSAAELLEQLRDALAGVTGAITQFTGTVQPPLTAVKDALAAVSQVLAAFDLAQPADAVVAVLNRARDVVAKIDVSVLPADAVSLVKDAANALKDIEIAPAVSEPITAILDQIDPTPLLQEASGFLADVRAQLQALDPSSLAVGLDAPIDAVLDGLAQLDPSQLRDRIDGLLAPVRDAIGQLDATELLAPATSAFAGLLGQLDATLDPAPIFAPLQELYQPIIDFVEALDPRRLIDLVAPHVGGATEAASGVVGPPAAVTGSADALRSLSSAGDAGDAMLGLRPGDLLLPLVDLHAKLVGALDALDGSVLDQAAHALHQALAAPVAALRPDRVLEALERGLAEAEATLGLVATSARVADAAAGYQRASVRIAVSARGVAAGSADATVAARVTLTLPSVDPLRLVPSGAQADALTLARAAGRARAELGGLRAAYATGLSRLQRLVPDFLGGDGLDGTGLRGALAALDPGPVRIEVNQIFDEIGHLLSGFGDVLAAALEEAAMAAEELLLAFNPLGLLDIVTRAHTAVVDQVKALSPEALERLVRFGYAAVRHQLEALDPARLAAEVDELRQSLLDALDGLLDGLLPDPAPFHELQARMAALRPSVLLGTLTAALQPVTDLVAALDPAALVAPLIEAIARVRDQLPDIVARIEVAFDEVLAAFPEGGITGVSVSASVSVH